MTDEPAEIRINVWDLTPANGMFRRWNFGFFHTSIVIGERSEFCFGVHPYEDDGIEQAPAVDKVPLRLEFVKHYKSVPIGPAKYSYDECMAILDEFKASSEWKGGGYNMFYHNCNTFTRKLCERLCETEYFMNYPFWVSRAERFFRPLYSISLAHILNIGEAPPMFRTIPNHLLHDSNPDF